MKRPDRSGGRAGGQIIVLFALVIGVVILGVGLVVDGGNALAQRRSAQNAADFAALAGARVISVWVDNDTVNGTDLSVRQAIQTAVTSNGGTAVTFGSPNGPQYVRTDGTANGFVGASTVIPALTAGVRVPAQKSFRPYFLGIAGISDWTASAVATAKGGYSLAGPPPGTLFPVGISQAFFATYPFCSGPISTNPSDPCYPQHLTPGNLNVPGGFGWLKFGCDGFGLGQDPPANAGGCSNNKPFLQGEIGPPSQTYGCCTRVGLPGSLDRIGSLPGNKASADCSYYITNQITVTVPIWDIAGGTGSNGWYHIIGFAGFQLTGCSGGKNIEGVWRKAFFPGAVTTTPPPAGAPAALGVQLIK